jgi:hypothetical protein
MKNSAKGIHFKLGVSLFLTLAIFTGSCHKNSDSFDGKSSSFDEFQITMMNGGGFSGEVTGYNIFSTGKVEYWRRSLAQKDMVLWQEAVSQGDIIKLRDGLLQSGMLASEMQKTGNMTTTVVYQTVDQSHRWSWESGTQLPDTVQEWYDSLEQFCQRISKQR